MSAGRWIFSLPPDYFKYPNARVTATLSGTLVPTVTEADIVAGSKTLICTLVGDTFIAAGAAFDAQRQAFINGSDGSGADPAGWDAVVRATQGVGGVVRTSDTVVTLTLDAFGTFDIASNETISWTIPASILTSGAAIVASPTFAVTAAAGAFTGRWYYEMVRVA